MAFVSVNTLQLIACSTGICAIMYVYMAMNIVTMFYANKIFVLLYIFNHDMQSTPKVLNVIIA